MRYNKLGRTGLLVSELSLGSNVFGGGDLPFWSKLGGLGQAAVNEIVAAAVAGGINLIDTADGYAQGQSEERIGQALRDLALDRREVVLATKGGTQTGRGPNTGGASRAHIVGAVEASLRRLQTDYIDIYMLHFFDPATPMDESIAALDDCVRAGKIRYFGCSNFSAWEVMKGVAHSDRLGLNRFAVLEEQWSLVTREIEREVVPMARDQGVGLMVWGPLVGGLLTGKYQDGAASGRLAGQGLPAAIDAEPLERAIAVLRRIGAAHGATPGQVALAWLLHQPAVSSVIVGSRSVDQLGQNLAATGLALTRAELDALAEAYPCRRTYAESVVGGARTRRAELVAPREIPA
jgi:aryl-alcohol dehydrogenase-like predicted oxidoreductase